MAVLIAEGMHETGITELKKAGLDIHYPSDFYEEDEIDTIIVRSVFEIREGIKRTFPNLKRVAKLGTGLDNIDLNHCEKEGIEVMSAPAMNAISTAEFTVMQLLCAFKNAYEIYSKVQKRDWRRHTYFGHEVLRKRVGLVGFGSVGKNIAHRLSPFVDELLIQEKTQQAPIAMGNIKFVKSLKPFYSKLDALIYAVNLKGNEQLINKAVLSKLRSNVFLINAARGALVDEKSLFKFLSENPNSKYFCDVLKDEPLYDLAPEKQSYKNPLLDLDNVIFTPHIAGMTWECQEDIARYICKLITRQIKNES